MWTNPRFEYLDSCDTKQEALECRQFRFKRFAPEGQAFFELEHEVRSVHHLQFAKPVEYTPR